MTTRISRYRVIRTAPVALLGTAILAACTNTPVVPTAAPTAAPPPTAAAAPATTAAPAPTTAPPPTVVATAVAPTATTAPQPTLAPTTVPATAAPSPTTATAPTAAAQPSATAATAARPADMAADQTLRVVMSYIPWTTEPAMGAGSLRFMSDLMYYPPFLTDDKGQTVPGVATKLDISDDGLKYTLHIDPRAVFSDGSKITASDVKFSWERVTDPAVKGWAAPYLTAPIVGYQDVVDGKTKDLKGVVARDDATVEITLGAPYTPFAKSLAASIAGILQKKNVQAGGEKWEDHAVSSGPYQLDSWNRDTGDMAWVPNKYWWGDKPIIQKILHRGVKDANTQSIMFDNNEMDVFQPTDIVAAQMLNGPSKSLLHLIPFGGSYFFFLRPKLKPMEDVNVRRALQKAVDMGKIVNAVFQGGQVPAYGIISPNLDGYSNPKPYYDPDGAKKALTASTYGSAANLPPIGVAIGSNLPEYQHIGEAMQQMWGDVLGIKDVNIKLIMAGTDPAAKTAQIGRGSVGTLINDTSAAIDPMGWSGGDVMKGNVEAKDDQLDQLLHKADTLPLSQEADRIALYRQAEQRLMDDAYYIPLTWVNYYYAVKPWVMNFTSNIDLCLYNMPKMSLILWSGPD